MWTPAHAYLHTNSFVHTENVFRSTLQNAGKRSDLSAAASSGTPALSLFNTEQRRPALAAFFNNNAVFFLDQSTFRYRALYNLALGVGGVEALPLGGGWGALLTRGCTG